MHTPNKWVVVQLLPKPEVLQKPSRTYSAEGPGLAAPEGPGGRRRADGEEAVPGVKGLAGREDSSPDSASCGRGPRRLRVAPPARAVPNQQPGVPEHPLPYEIQIWRARPPAQPALARSGIASLYVSRGLTKTGGGPCAA